MAADEKETRRELLSKAWEEAEEKDDGEKTETVDKPDLETSEGNSPIKSGEDKAGDTPESGEKPKLEEEQNKKEAAAAAGIERKPAVSVPASDRAPNSWKPATREHWAKLPAEVREQIRERERSIEQELTRTAQVRRFAQDFATAINPYAHLIRAQNSTPIQAVTNLMQTAAGLMQGNATQKAQIAAEIINNYGIDIQVLDQVLTNTLQNRGSNPNQVAPVPDWARPIFGFMDNVNKMQEQRQQQMQQEADEAIQSFSEKPFFDDVREDMADLMEAAANRGRVMTIDQAYEKAIALNPDIAKIVGQRKLAEANRNPISEAAATLARARKASSTVKGAPQGSKAGAPNGKMSRRQQLSEAWDDASS